MVRIDTTDPTARYRYKCPSPLRHTDWRVIDGVVHCRSCAETYRALYDDKTGRTVPREDIDFLGPHADTKGRFGDAEGA